MASPAAAASSSTPPRTPSPEATHKKAASVPDAKAAGVMQAFIEQQQEASPSSAEDPILPTAHLQQPHEVLYPSPHYYRPLTPEEQKLPDNTFAEAGDSPLKTALKKGALSPRKESPSPYEKPATEAEELSPRHVTFDENIETVDASPPEEKTSPQEESKTTHPFRFPLSSTQKKIQSGAQSFVKVVRPTFASIKVPASILCLGIQPDPRNVMEAEIRLFDAVVNDAKQMNPSQICYFFFQEYVTTKFPADYFYNLQVLEKSVFPEFIGNKLFRKMLPHCELEEVTKFYEERLTSCGIHLTPEIDKKLVDVVPVIGELEKRQIGRWRGHIELLSNNPNMTVIGATQDFTEIFKVNKDQEEVTLWKDLKTKVKTIQEVIKHLEEAIAKNKEEISVLKIKRLEILAQAAYSAAITLQTLGVTVEQVDPNNLGQKIVSYLTVLKLRNLGITRLPEWILSAIGWSRLKKFLVDNNFLTEFPILRLASDVEEISAAGNLISDFPNEVLTPNQKRIEIVQLLPKIKYISVQSNPLRTLPLSLAYSRTLETIDARDTFITIEEKNRFLFEAREFRKKEENFLKEERTSLQMKKGLLSEEEFIRREQELQKIELDLPKEKNILIGELSFGNKFLVPVLDDDLELP